MRIQFVNNHPALVQSIAQALPFEILVEDFGLFFIPPIHCALIDIRHIYHIGQHLLPLQPNPLTCTYVD